jgi:hypothetical protein
MSTGGEYRESYDVSIQFLKAFSREPFRDIFGEISGSDELLSTEIYEALDSTSRAYLTEFSDGDFWSLVLLFQFFCFFLGCFFSLY